MTKDLELQLQAKYSKMFIDLYNKKTNLSFGIRTKDGWFKIIDKLCFDIKEYCNKYNLKIPIITEIKSKFRMLRFSYNKNLYNKKEVKLCQRIDNLILQAESQSLVTCEMCGNDGEYQIYQSWVWTLCNNCFKKIGDLNDTNND